MTSGISPNTLSQLSGMIPQKVKERWNQLPPGAAVAGAGAVITVAGLAYLGYRWATAEREEAVVSAAETVATAQTPVSTYTPPATPTVPAPVSTPVKPATPTVPAPVSTYTPPATPTVPAPVSTPVKPAVTPRQRPMFTYEYNRAGIEQLKAATDRETINLPMPNGGGFYTTRWAQILETTKIRDTQNNLIPIYVKKTDHSGGHTDLSIHAFITRDLLASATFKHLGPQNGDFATAKRLYGEEAKAIVYAVRFECPENLQNAAAEVWLKALIQYFPSYEGRLLVSIGSYNKDEKPKLLAVGLQETEPNLFYLPPHKHQELIQEVAKNPIQMSRA